MNLSAEYLDTASSQKESLAVRKQNFQSYPGRLTFESVVTNVAEFFSITGTLQLQHIVSIEQNFTRLVSFLVNMTQRTEKMNLSSQKLLKWTTLLFIQILGKIKVSHHKHFTLTLWQSNFFKFLQAAYKWRNVDRDVMTTKQLNVNSDDMLFTRVTMFLYCIYFCVIFTSSE